MINKTIARRYAHAYLTLAMEKNILDRAEQDLKAVAAGVQESQQLTDVLAHKLIPADEKKALAKAVFGSLILPETLNFLLLTIDKRRELYWPEMAEEFSNLADQVRNLSKAQVVSAVEMKREDVAELERKLSKATGRNIKVNVAIDPAILGGLIVKIGDEVMDGSVQKRLELMKNNLKGINFTVSGVN
ncbi:MAG: ATP synthase F1 subunit delta [Clostridia bacterium]|jgi:F-type H+-transporting ATPase subunit delta|nr:ATP synthase F1 subunit delta [Clostridia bacterium]